MPEAARNLADEQCRLRELVDGMPGLRLYQVAAARGLPTSTCNAYLNDPAAARYRPLNKREHADILWAVLRELGDRITAALPENNLPAD